MSYMLKKKENFKIRIYYINNVNKINGIFFSVVLIAVEGMWVLWQARGWIARGICCLWVLIYCWGFRRFAQYYYSGAYTADNRTMPYFDITVEEGIAHIQEDPLLRERVTYMAESGIYFAMIPGYPRMSYGYGSGRITGTAILSVIP